MQAFDFLLHTESTTPHPLPQPPHSTRNRAVSHRQTTTKRPAASNPSSRRVPANSFARSDRSLPAGDSRRAFHLPDEVKEKKPRGNRGEWELRGTQSWNTNVETDRRWRTLHRRDRRFHRIIRPIK